MSRALPAYEKRFSPAHAWSLIRTMRPLAWIKNILLLFPFILHPNNSTSPQTYIDLLLGVVCFCFASSCAYVINDWYDKDADLVVNPSRPCAHGLISRPTLLALTGICLLGTMATASTLPSAFQWRVAEYMVGTTVYSITLKTYALIDLLVVALCHTWRILAGAAIVEQDIDMQTAVALTSVFLVLPSLKRVAELRRISMPLPRRAYAPEDINILLHFSHASALFGCFVFLLDTIDENAIYLAATFLLLCFRWSLLANRGAIIAEDPLSSIIKDSPTYFLLVIMAILVFHRVT